MSPRGCPLQVQFRPKLPALQALFSLQVTHVKLPIPVRGLFRSVASSASPSPQYLPPRIVEINSKTAMFSSAGTHKTTVSPRADDLAREAALGFRSPSGWRANRRQRRRLHPICGEHP